MLCVARYRIGGLEDRPAIYYRAVHLLTQLTQLLFYAQPRPRPSPYNIESIAQASLSPEACSGNEQLIFRLTIRTII